MSVEEQANDIAKFISKISREYPPLADSNLPDRVVEGLRAALCCGHPSLQDFEVYGIMN